MGKVLSISNSGRELIRVPLTKNSLTIGRSPLCDVTLRFPGIYSVHYLLDWALDGDFNPDAKNQEWSLINVSKMDIEANDSKKNVSGLGQIIGESPLDIDQFTFEIIEDRLEKTRLDTSIIQRSLLKLKDGYLHLNSIGEKKWVLEVIRSDIESGTVTEVAHIDYRPSQASFFPIKTLPHLQVQWGSSEKIVFKYNEDQSKVKINQWVSHRLKNQNSNTQSEYYLESEGFLQIDTFENEYYFRLVPKVQIPIIHAEWRHDKFLWVFFIFMILGFSIFQGINRLPRALQSQDVKPPRIARVEIYRPKKELPAPTILPIQPPPPTPSPIEPPPPPPKLKETTDTIISTKSANKPSSSAIPLKKDTKSKSQARKVKQDQVIVPDKPVESVGL